MVAEINSWSQEDMALELATSLRDTALGVLGDVEVSERRNYNILVLSLTNRFEPPNYAEVYKAELKSRLRSKDENLCVLAQDIKRLIRKAYVGDPKTTRDKLARDAFIDALNEVDMEWEVYQKKPASIDHALQLAMEYEAFNKARRHRTGERRGLRMQSGDVQRETTGTEYRSPPAQAEIRPQTTERKRFEGECFYCKRRGHRQYQCQTFKQDLEKLKAQSSSTPAQSQGNSR
jgi:hypothetical protein